VAQPVDRNILQEIVRIIESRKKVPERVRVRNREYQITYLEDHQRRLQDALQRYDSDRLNMLYGQLASKVKYQLLRRLPGREARPVRAERRPAAARRGPAAKTPKAKLEPAKKVAAKRVKVKASGRKPGRGRTSRGSKPAKKTSRR
jgi:hypothetical protein